MTVRSFSQMWFVDYVARRGLSIGEWKDSVVVVATASVLTQNGDVIRLLKGEELVAIPLSLIETDIDEAFEYVDDAIRLEECFGS
jgi:hypothetical protein